MTRPLSTCVWVACCLVGTSADSILSAIHYTTVGTGNFETQWVFIDTKSGSVQTHMSMDWTNSCNTVPAVVTPDNGALVTLSGGGYTGPGTSLHSYGTLAGTLQIDNSTDALVWDSEKQQLIALTRNSSYGASKEACVSAINIQQNTSSAITCLPNVSSYMSPLALDAKGQQLFLVNDLSLSVVNLQTGASRSVPLSCSTGMQHIWWEMGKLVALTQPTNGNLTLSTIDVATGKCADDIVLAARAQEGARLQVALDSRMESLAFFDGPDWAQSALVSINLKSGNVSRVALKNVPSAGNFGWLGYPSPAATNLFVV